ncbi:hypothetical protein LIER_18170 [Lithospermum erythrorhizon]|uniref:Uncharacterized protein n=1 Tax=Lithospermum erythrorhizon TaxID=34254 RepID=A0AAV3QH44_LITER
MEAQKFISKEVKKKPKQKGGKTAESSKKKVSRKHLEAQVFKAKEHQRHLSTTRRVAATPKSLLKYYKKGSGRRALKELQEG